jgi:hypothetical protein
VSNENSYLRPLKLDDFIQAKAKVLIVILISLLWLISLFLTSGYFLTQVSSSVSYDATSMNELRKWNEQYGEGGSRTKSPFGFGN